MWPVAAGRDHAVHPDGPDHLGQDGHGDLGGCLRADRQPDGGVHASPFGVGEREVVKDRIAADLAGDQTDIAHAGVECRPDHLGLGPAVRGDHDRSGLCQVGVTIAVHLVTERGGHGGQRLCDRCGTADADQRRGHLWVEEDFQCTAGQTRIDDHACARCLRKVDFAVGQHTQQDAFTCLQRAECRLADRALRTLATDEALDGAIRQQDRLIAGVCGGRMLCPHHCGVHERRPRAPQLLDPFAHRHGSLL